MISTFSVISVLLFDQAGLLFFDFLSVTPESAKRSSGADRQGNFWNFWKSGVRFSKKALRPSCASSIR